MKRVYIRETYPVNGVLLCHKWECLAVLPIENFEEEFRNLCFKYGKDNLRVE